MRQRASCLRPALGWLLAASACLACGEAARSPDETEAAPASSASSPGVAAHTAPTDETPEAGEISGARPWFRDLATRLGVEFRHRDGRSGRRYYLETAASGGGWLDADGDGDLDLYLINGAAMPGSDLEYEPRNALYQQRDGRFVEVSEAAGVGDTSYGFGLCTGDADGDGLLDLFVSNYGADRLYRNLGPGPDGVPRFVEIGEQAGVAGSAWGVGCAFSDLDLDGDLDLYVVNYLDYSFSGNRRCGDAVRQVWSYCRPDIYAGQPDYLYVNQGRSSDARGLDGVRFRQEGAARGLEQGKEEKGFAVMASDLDGDGAPELLVTNDGALNRLYANDGRAFFTERGLSSGFALDRTGRAQSSMGLALGDVDGDGLPEALLTHYAFETNTLYDLDARLVAADSTEASGLGPPSFLRVAWGVAFFDYDNDGDLDAAIANGHVMDNVDLFDTRVGYPQANQLFENDGQGLFVDVSSQAGPAFAVARVSRALAVGDWDDDGWLDLLITNTNGPAELLHNELSQIHPGRHWVGFRLIGPVGNRPAIGARMDLYRGEQRLGQREVHSGGSFLSQSDLRLHFGLGLVQEPVRAKLRWPDGLVQSFSVNELDRYHELRHPSAQDGRE